LVDFKEIINSDHRGFIIDIDINEYFAIVSSDYDYADNVILDPTKRSHREKFVQKLDEYIDQLDIEETVNRLCNSSITGKEIDRLDKSITFVLDSARKYVEGNTRTVLFTHKKMKIRTAMLYYKALKNKIAGKNVDEVMMERRRKVIGLENELLTLQQAKQKYEEANNNWVQYQKEVKEQREKELLNMYPVEIASDNEDTEKRRK